MLSAATGEAAPSRRTHHLPSSHRPGGIPLPCAPSAPAPAPTLSSFFANLRDGVPPSKKALTGSSAIAATSVSIAASAAARCDLRPQHHDTTPAAAAPAAGGAGGARAVAPRRDMGRAQAGAGDGGASPHSEGAQLLQLPMLLATLAELVMLGASSALSRLQLDRLEADEWERNEAPGPAG